ncbi:hypothetical protein SUGI_1063010 [Cryptomeria japonica]|nr:hypothetical protein SUGI_1063010 [Cryptomeria japonica]
MSQPQLFTIDFLRIESDNNGSPQSDSAMDCHQQLVHSRSTQSCLGKIRPHLLQQDKSQSALLDTEIEISKAVTTNPAILYNYPRQSVSNSEESTQGGKQRHAVKTSNANLPMAKRLSLQRFLQKRKDRLSKLVPYTTSSM